MSTVAVQDVSLVYHSMEGEIHALSGVNLQVDDEEFVSIVGPSGCGKSTLLSIIAGLIRPTTGQVTVGGEVVSGPSRRVGYMLQHDYLFEWRTILDNALLGLEVMGERDRESTVGVRRLMENYGLGGFEHNYPRQLSGGMRQRAALIRTLAVNPDVLLLDEPFSALDYQTRLRVAEEVYMILEKERKTVVMVTHDIAEAVSFGDRVIVMSHRPGTVVADHRITFSCKRRTPLRTREQPEFREYFNKVWQDLNVGQHSIDLDDNACAESASEQENEGDGND